MEFYFSHVNLEVEKIPKKIRSLPIIAFQHNAIEWQFRS